MIHKETGQGTFARVTVGTDGFIPLKQRWMQLMSKFEKGTELVFLKWGVLLFIVGVMLGRAAILSDLYPFALPFFAAVFVLKKNRALLAATAILVGTIWGLTFNLPHVLIGMVGFLVLYKLFKTLMIQTRWALPVAVLVTSFLTRIAITYVSMGTVTQYHWMMGAIEAGLALMLTMIFLQSLPLITHKRKQRSLKSEEIICFIILIASVMTGAIGWVIYGLGAEHILARYLVLLFALAGGATIGATVGVVTGLVLSLAAVVNLYQMSLLAFAGLLGGLLKDGNKIGVSAGLLVGTALIALYGQGLSSAGITVMESVAAIALFLLTPKSAIQYMAKYVPGTTEHSKEQQRYMRKIRDVTAARVERFSDLFQTLSSSFTNDRETTYTNEKDLEGDRFLATITASTCQKCFRKETCWAERFDTTYDVMEDVMTDIEQGDVQKGSYDRLKRHCIYPDRIVKTMKEQWGPHELRKTYAKQLEESRRLVADQLQGVSQVMGEFAREIQKEKETHDSQEEQIHEAIQEAGIDIGQVDVYNLTPRDVRVEIELGEDVGREEAEKLIAPMLSGILNDHIIVDPENDEDVEDGKVMNFVSAKTYTVDSGAATVAQGGAWLSGDNHAAMQLGFGKFAVAISDGMGNGKKAHDESKATLKLLENLLQSGIDEKVAIQSMNSVLSLRADEEMFSTLDLTIIDLQTADTSFIKIGSMPSFIKRGGQVSSVESGNLPMGIISEANFDVVSRSMQDEDLLIMMSDGMFDGVKHVENKERWMRRIISEMETEDPQTMSDLLLEEVIRVSDGKIDDDMTVVVTKIRRNTPRWAKIPMQKWVPQMYKEA
ncbi:stage II sporulation protein E [Geomicrobium sp. JCM 19038]|uniref:stage II sporulation protein E n=1 Tax=Geomicrobium sp. JCM 19038 TaxID=1460635 RepID=UPI00045F1B75|nr:stage II sporulation protein E [Geomicrobium sp. JCM 19038]GAK09995.1 stage II sporulation serine phosphatase for sigma-F activation [Geomicrobium sp. JCM 19038]